MAKKEFLMNVKDLRERARQHMEMGAVTPGYKADRETVIKILNEALATELVCVLRYKQNYYVAEGIKAKIAAEEFLEHANEEQEHADTLAERIVQLGGSPNFDPAGLAGRSHSEYVEKESLEEMIKENLIAERIAVESYKEMIDYIGNDDPTTRRMLEQILEVEEEHADDLLGLLEAV